MELAEDNHPGFDEFCVDHVDQGQSNQDGFDNGYHTGEEDLFRLDHDDDDGVSLRSVGSYGGEDYKVNGGDDEMFDGYVTPSLTQSHSTNQPSSQILNVEDR